MSRSRSGRTIDDDLFRKIVDEAKTIPYIKEVILQGLNEPLLDRKLEERVTYIRKAGLICAIYTNGVLLTRTKVDSLVEAGLTVLVVSLNANTQEQHQDVMGIRGKFDTICDAIDYASGLRRMVVRVHAVFDGQKFSRQDIEDFLGRWGDDRYGGRGRAVLKGNWSGDVSVDTTVRELVHKDVACSRALQSIYVMYDGRVSTCCFDPLGKQVFGDLNHQTLREVYNSPEYVAFREAHSLNRASRYDICKNCTRI